MKLFNLLILFLFSQITFAQTTYAVVVGVADYKILNDGNGDLKYADSDAAHFSDFLKSAAGGNVSAQNIILLRNKAATEASILQSMQIFQKAGPNDRIIFYFSGHGLEKAFVPYDVQQNNAKSLLTHAEVKTAFKASKATTKLIIADACMSGSMKSKEVPVSAEKAVKEFDKLNVAMILSSRSKQTSMEMMRIKGGLFTFYLLNGLNGKQTKIRTRK